MNEAESPARKATASATVSGVPMRPSGIWSMRALRAASGSAAVISVSM